MHRWELCSVLTNMVSMQVTAAMVVVGVMASPLDGSTISAHKLAVSTVVLSPLHINYQFGHTITRHCPTGTLHFVGLTLLLLAMVLSSMLLGLGFAVAGHHLALLLVILTTRVLIRGLGRPIP